MAKATKADQQVMTLLAKVKAQKQTIERAEKPKWLTNCSFVYEGRTINLHTVSDLGMLVELAGFLKGLEADNNAGAEALGVDFSPLVYSGYTVDQWIADFKTRLGKLQIAAEKKKLEELETRLDALVSPEKRRELELAAIAEELG